MYYALKPDTLPKFFASCEKVANLLKQPYKKIVHEQVGFVLARAILVTPPKKQKQGQKRVAIDFAKIWALRMPTAAPKGKYRVRLNRYIRKGQYSKAQTMLNCAHIPGVAKGFSIADHKRDSFGHTKQKATKIITIFKLVKNYMKKEQALVGTEKNGWRPGANVFGAAIPDYTNGLPVFGRVKNFHDEKSGKMDIEIVNSSRGIQNANQENRILEFAFKGRGAAMMKRVKYLLQAAKYGVSTI